PQTLQTDVHALDDPAGGEVEMDGIVATEFRAEEVAVAWHFAQGDTEQALTKTAAVIGRGVDEVHPQVEGHADRADRLVEIDGAELLPKRRGSETEGGKLQAGAAEGSKVHDGGIPRMVAGALLVYVSRSLLAGRAKRKPEICHGRTNHGLVV